MTKTKKIEYEADSAMLFLAGKEETRDGDEGMVLTALVEANGFQLFQMLSRLLEECPEVVSVFKRVMEEYNKRNDEHDCKCKH